MGRPRSDPVDETAMDNDEDEELPLLSAGTKQYKLQFNQGSHKVNAGELSKRLKTLHDELAKPEQDDLDPSSVQDVARALVAPGLLSSKDKGVKAITACCIAEILRHTAPEAPYTGPELRDIFTFFFRQLRYLTGAGCPNYNEYYTLLDSLHESECHLLIVELPNAEKIMTDLFNCFFEISKPDTPRNISLLLSTISQQLLNHAAALPSDVIDTLLTQFLPRSVKTNPASLALAVDICSAKSDKLQGYVAQYFTETIINVVRDRQEMESDDEDIRYNKRGNGKTGEHGSGIADQQDFIVAHELIKQINRSCPSLLTNVTPLLEEELIVEDLGVRILAIQTLGDMFADKPLEKAGSLVAMVTTSARSDLAKRAPRTWRAWLARSRDRGTAARLAVIDLCKDILAEHSELGKDIYTMMRARLTDADDKVRTAACAAFGRIDYETAVHALEKNTIAELADRMFDKRPMVASEALRSLARLYGHAYGEVANGNETAVDRFAWIPQEILKIANLPEPERSLNAECNFIKHVLPLPSSDSAEAELAWAERLLIVTSYLDAGSQKLLYKLGRLHERRPSMYTMYLDAAERYNGGVLEADAERIKQSLDVVCRYLSSTFGDPVRAEQDLHKLANLNDQRVYKLLRTLMDSRSEVRAIVKARQEVIRRIEGSLATVSGTFEAFITQSALLIYNRSLIPLLLSRIQNAADLENEDDREQAAEAADLAESHLQVIAKHKPELFTPSIEALVEVVLQSEDNRTLEIALHALSMLVLQDAEGVATNFDRHSLERVYHFALSGTVLQAKYAATIIVKMLDDADKATELVRDISDALPASSGLRLLSYLAALKRLAKHAPIAFGTREGEITAALMKLMRPDPINVNASSPNRNRLAGPAAFHTEWVADEQLSPEDKACIEVVKILTNRCAAVARLPKATATSAEKLVKLLLLLLTVGQDENKRFRVTEGLPARYRLQAALSLLRLATFPVYDGLVAAHIHQLALITQDSAFQVRAGFVHKTVAFIHNRRLQSYKYLTMLFLTIHDPDFENSAMSMRCVQTAAKSLNLKERAAKIDILLVRLLHLLAHHPDFSTEPEELKSFVRYIEFFLDCIANKENISLLFYLSQRTKTVRDGESTRASENLYILSDLAHYTVKAYADRRHWTIDTFPGGIRMPGDIFKPLPSKEIAGEIRQKVYLDDASIQALGVIGAGAKLDAAAKKSSNAATSKPRKVANIASGNVSKSRAARAKREPAMKPEPKGKANRVKNTDNDDIAVPRLSAEECEDEDENAYASMDSEEERLQKEEDEEQWAQEQEKLQRTNGSVVAKRKSAIIKERKGKTGHEEDEEDEEDQIENRTQVNGKSKGKSDAARLAKRPRRGQRAMLVANYEDSPME